MTHFAVIVLVGKNDNIERAVERLLEPYNEDGEWFREGSKWDSWVIGGRWTGGLDGYDPTTDPRNLETCKFCENGICTQRIADQYPAYQDGVGKTCRQCKGTAKVVKWQLAPHSGDVMPVAELLERTFELPLAIVTPDGKWHEQGEAGWFDNVWEPEVRRLLAENPDKLAVLVDCHV